MREKAVEVDKAVEVNFTMEQPNHGKRFYGLNTEEKNTLAAEMWPIDKRGRR